MKLYILIILLIILILFLQFYNYTIKNIHLENFKDNIPNYDLLTNGFPKNNAFQIQSREKDATIFISNNNNNFYFKNTNTPRSSVFVFIDKYLYSLTDGYYVNIVENKDGGMPDKFNFTNNQPKDSNVVWSFRNGNLSFYFQKQKVDKLSKKYLPKSWTNPKIYYIHFNYAESDTQNQMFIDNNRKNNEFYLNVIKKNLSNELYLNSQIVDNKINQKYIWNIEKVPQRIRDKYKSYQIEYDILFPKKFSNDIIINKNNQRFELFSKTNIIFYIQIYYIQPKTKPSETDTKKISTSKINKNKPKINNNQSSNDIITNFNIENHKQYPNLVRKISTDVAKRFGIYDPESKLYYRCKDVINEMKENEFQVEYEEYPGEFINTSIMHTIDNEKGYDPEKLQKEFLQSQLKQLSNRLDKRIRNIETKIVDKKEKPIIIHLKNNKNQNSKKSHNKVDKKIPKKTDIKISSKSKGKKQKSQSKDDTVDYLF